MSYVESSFVVKKDMYLMTAGKVYTCKIDDEGRVEWVNDKGEMELTDKRLAKKTYGNMQFVLSPDEEFRNALLQL